MSSVSSLSSSSLKLDYLNLLVTQLKNQNPLEPIENTEFTAQLAQMSQLEQLENLNGSFAGVLAIQQQSMDAAAWDQAANLFGKSVTYEVDGVSGAGTVTKVTQTSDGPVLPVGDKSVFLGQILSIQS